MALYPGLVALLQNAQHCYYMWDARGESLTIASSCTISHCDNFPIIPQGIYSYITVIGKVSLKFLNLANQITVKASAEYECSKLFKHVARLMYQG